MTSNGSCNVRWHEYQGHAAMMGSQDLPAHENLAQSLGLKPGFCTFLVQTTTGLRLESKSIKDGGGGVTVTLHFCNQNSDHGKFHKDDHDKNSRASKSMFNGGNRKKKSPSHLKRDRERLLKFRENHRRKKVQSEGKTLLTQCLPPPDVTINIDKPPTITVAPVDPETVTLETSPDPALPVQPPNSQTSVALSCMCEICQHFNEDDT